jgi:uncharacterized protein YbjT (DUF2867 family)
MMKLLIAGVTGLVGTEIVGENLQNDQITSVIALARRPVNMDGLDTTKLKTVIVDDYGAYSEQVKAEMKEVGACIW